MIINGIEYEEKQAKDSVEGCRLCAFSDDTDGCGDAPTCCPTSYWVAKDDN